MFASFDTNLFRIPAGAIYVDCVQFNKELDGQEIWQDSNHGLDEMNALVSTLGRLIEDNNGKAFVLIAADTLAGKHADNALHYQAAGKRYLEFYRRYYAELPLAADKLIVTSWEDWRSQTAINLLASKVSINHKKPEQDKLMQSLAACFDSSIARELSVRDQSVRQIDWHACSTLEDFKAIFDDLTLLPANRSVESLVPSLTVACEFLNYLYESQDASCEFRAMVNKEVNQLVQVETNKLKNKSKDTVIDIQMLTKNIRDYLLEKAAQYLVMGIMARIFKRPVRFFQKETNKITRYIEHELIGRNPDGELAIQTVVLTFVESARLVKHKSDDGTVSHYSASTEFFKKNPSFYSKMKCRRYTANSLNTAADSVEVPLEFILQNTITYLRKPDTPLNVLTMVADEVRYIIDILKRTNSAGRSCQSSPKQLFRMSADASDSAELFLHLRAYLSSGRAALNTLEIFAGALSKVQSERAGQGCTDARINVSVTRQPRFDTDLIAVIDSSIHDIPEGSILADGICMKQAGDGIVIDECNTGAWLRAMLNLADRLITEKHCQGFLVQVGDTLAAVNAGDADHAPYQAAGKKYLTENKRYYSALSLDRSNIYFTTWEEWCNNSAVALLLESAHRNTKSTLADYKEAFDRMPLSCERIKSISPSFDISCAYLRYLYESGAGVHKEFRVIADKIIQEIVSAEVNKLRNRYKRQDIDIQAITNNKREYLLREAAQYFLLGIMSVILNIPIRFLHNGTNAAFTYVENYLVGKLPGGDLAIQMVNVRFVSLEQSASMIRANQLPIPANAIHDSSSKVGESLRVSFLLSVMLHLTDDNTSLNLLTMVLALLKYNMAIKKPYNHFERLYYSPINNFFPCGGKKSDRGGLFFHLMSYLASDTTTYAMLSSLKSCIKSRITHRK